VDGVIANGEGQSEEVPLHTGEMIGTGLGPKVDVALCALEGRTACAKGGHNALSLVALTDDGGFLKVPDDVYMEKLAVGPGLPSGLLDLDAPPAEMIKRLAKAKNVPVAEITACVLDRPRHSDLIGKLYDIGIKVVLIDDGDVSGAIATGMIDSTIDIYMGSGGAAQGVLAAAGLKCLGGQMQCRFLLRNDEERVRCRRFGLDELDRKLDIGQMVSGEVMLAATGITDGHLLKGVSGRGEKAVSHSLVMRSLTGTIRWLTAHHDLKKLGMNGLDRPSHVH
jgi:fructose-1,6-bisphosphatase II / sedoheptulose-1,7-bisphosphatase